MQKEVIQALPKLIKLNPIVVKEVFNRLLGTQHGRGRGQPRDTRQPPGWETTQGASPGIPVTVAVKASRSTPT